jgi:hypothetical protein
MRWAEFRSDAGEFGRDVQRLLEAPGVLLVATVRADGTPRLSPVEPFFWDGELWLAMMWRSRKSSDLKRDPRILVHNIVKSREGDEGEAKVRGRAFLESDPSRRAAICRAIGEALPWEPDPERVELFRVDLESVSFVRYESNGDQQVVLWPERRRFVRRLTSATSVGEPEDESAF